MGIPNHAFALLVGTLVAAGCGKASGLTPAAASAKERATIAEGKTIFRYETFGDERYWTDTLRMHEVIEKGVSPKTAFSVGFKVDVNALPASLRASLAAGKVDLEASATTVALLKLNAVVGLKGVVEKVNGVDRLTHVGITCAMCHSTVNNSFAPGIGVRLDGHPNRDLNVGAIVALSPAVPVATKTVLNAWGPGKYDPRMTLDGRSTPLVLPPAYGLQHVAKETYTATGPVSYWNAYVAVTQMHGAGSFADSRLGLHIISKPDLVTGKLAALRAYQFSLAPPRPASRSFDAPAASRGRLVFNTSGKCATCHNPATSFTDINAGKMHDPSETGMDEAYANRTPEKRYRTTPLRGAWQHPPYFHDGSAPTLEAVVAHYDHTLSLGLTGAQKSDLVQYLKSL